MRRRDVEGRTERGNRRKEWRRDGRGAEGGTAGEEQERIGVENK